MSLDNWRTLNRLIARPGASAASRRCRTTLVWLDRAITAMMTLSGLRARRHDARHRLALPVDGPARRAAGDDVRRPAGGDRRGRDARARLAARARRLERHLPLALPRARPNGCRCSTCWCATTPIRARSRSRPRAWPSTSPSSRRATARFAGDALAPAHAGPARARSRPTCDPESERAAPTPRRSCSARPTRSSDDDLAEVLLARACAQRAVAGGRLSRCDVGRPTRYTASSTRRAMRTACRWRSRGSSRI